MPLHLLGKKSWNVYNADNIARVRRDEAAAAAAEHAAEQRMQEADAARRLALLRGETLPPPPGPAAVEPSDGIDNGGDGDGDGDDDKLRPARRGGRDGPARKRKRAGEDDTDFEMRVARERAEAGDRARGQLAAGQHPGGADGGPRRGRQQAEVGIVGRDGHIDLVGAPPSALAAAAATEKNPEYEREAAKKKRELEDQYTMRFSNAAGRDVLAAGDPWYARSDDRNTTAPTATKEELDAEVGMEAPTRNVWGNEDPRRRVREAQRLVSSDPLAMMKMGAKKVREVEKERKREAEEREKELRELRREERRREKRRRREKHDGDDDGAGDHRRHRSDRSEHARRRHEDDGRGERRHGHRSDRERGRDGDMSRKRTRDHDHGRERGWDLENRT